MRCAVAILLLSAAGAASAACPPAPRAICRLGGRNNLALTAASSDTGDRLKWRWRKGAAGAAGDFGDPLAGTALSLCVYDGVSLVAAIDLPAGGTCRGAPCWQADSAGFTYADPDGSHGGVRSVKLRATSTTSVSLSAKGGAVPLPALPASAPLTVQLLRADSDVCFESIFAGDALTRNDAGRLRARLALGASTPLPPLPSDGCGTPLAGYTPGTSTADALVHDGVSRSFRVYVPTGYDASVPTPIVFLLHGGFGSGAQVEANANLTPVAEANGFIVVAPDGVASPAGVRTWNAGGCCGFAQATGVDDVGFVSAVIDRLEGVACVDRRRVYATGMSNGAMLSHRLACDLSARIRAVVSVAGAMLAAPCAPVRTVPVMEIHGTADPNVPYAGGAGCGVAGVAFPSVAETIGGWVTRDACKPAADAYLVEGDGTCTRRGNCPVGADVVQCDVAGGGHNWPGGDPSGGGLPGCPSQYQSQTFHASEVLWTFFTQHPPR